MAFMTALVAAGIGMQALGSYNQAQGAKQSAAFNRDMALVNAQIAGQNVRDIELRGRQAEYDQRKAVARELSSVRAATAANGLVVNEAGTTPQDMVRAMAEAGELDAMRLRNNIEREKRTAEIQGTQYTAQAGQFDAERRSISPFRSAFTTALSGVTNSSNADILFGG